jgi:hypothetical protein
MTSFIPLVATILNIDHKNEDDPYPIIRRY